MQIPGGRLVDRRGAWTLGVWALVAVVAGNVIALLAPSFALGIAGRLVAGLGTGAGFVAGSDYVRATVGTPTAQGLYGASGVGGGGLALAVVPLAVPGLDWRAPYVTALVFALIVLAALPLAPRDTRRGAVERGRISDVVHDRRLYPLAVAHSASFGLSVIAGNWAVSLLRDDGYTRGVAGAVAALTLLSGLVTRPLGGRLIERAPGRAAWLFGTSMTAVRLENVHKSFGENEVLKGIDLELADHEVVCLIGASGSGKSTLLRCVNLLERLNDGRIFLGGEEITRRGVDVNAVRRRIGIVFQAFNLFPHMTVLRNVTLAPRDVLNLSRREAEERALELLGRFGLADRRDEYPDRLSGGQQQRVAIVRALAMRPELMLLDEVTSALDPELVAEVLNVIRELAEGGMTMLIATHEMGFARDIARRVCFLDGGLIVEEGLPDEIFARPKQARTQRFLERIIEAGRL